MSCHIFNLTKMNFMIVIPLIGVWYDYEKDGFGPVFYSSKELNKYVITKNFSEECSANIHKERLNNLLRGHSGVLKHPSENIYSRIIKSMGKRRRL